MGKLGNIFWETLAHTNLNVLFMFALQSLNIVLTCLIGKTMFLVLETFENMWANLETLSPQQNISTLWEAANFVSAAMYPDTGQTGKH